MLQYMVEVHRPLGPILHRISNIVVEAHRDGAEMSSYVDAVLMGPDDVEMARRAPTATSWLRTTAAGQSAGASST